LNDVPLCEEDKRDFSERYDDDFLAQSNQIKGEIKRIKMLWTQSCSLLLHYHFSRVKIPSNILKIPRQPYDLILCDWKQQYETNLFCTAFNKVPDMV
jgi:hypothetical protein